MAIKSIKYWSEEECMTFLQNNPNAPIASEVQKRLDAIADEKRKTHNDKELGRQTSVIFKNHWIDINQIIDERKYKNFGKSPYFFLVLFGISVPAVIVLAILAEEYRLYDDVLGVFLRSSFLIAVCSLVVSSGLFSRNSPLIGEIDYIESGSKSDIFRPIQNKQGKSGLCRLDTFRIWKLLPLEYDLVCGAKKNSFICKKDSKYGLYDATKKKMVIPVMYDEVYSLEEDVIKLVKDGLIYSFTYEGYRIVG